MKTELLLLPALALGLQAFAQSPQVPPPVKPAEQTINADDLILVHPTPYRPTLVRDPFSAPTDAEQTNKGDLVDDIAIKGIVKSHGKTLAVVSDARGTIRTIGVGFKFRDGELISIDDKSATFHQWDASSSNTRAYRTVVKTFKREEGKR